MFALASSQFIHVLHAACMDLLQGILLILPYLQEKH